MTSCKARTKLGVLAVLTPGDAIQARDDTGQKWTGTVDLVAPLLGIVWMWTDKGERKAFDVHDHEIQTL